MKKIDVLKSSTSRDFGRRAVNFIFENPLIGGFAEAVGMVPSGILKDIEKMKAAEKQLLKKKIQEMLDQSQLAENFTEDLDSLVGKFVALFRLKTDPKEEKKYHGEASGRIKKIKKGKPTTAGFFQDSNIFSLKLIGDLFFCGVNPPDKIFVSDDDPFLSEKN